MFFPVSFVEHGAALQQSFFRSALFRKMRQKSSAAFPAFRQRELFVRRLWIHLPVEGLILFQLLHIVVPDHIRPHRQVNGRLGLAVISLEPGQGVFRHLPQGVLHLDPLLLPELGAVQHLHHRVVHGGHQGGSRRLGKDFFLVPGRFQQVACLVGIQMVQQMQVRLLVDLLLDLRQRHRIAETQLLRQFQFLITENIDAAGPIPLKCVDRFI